MEHLSDEKKVVLEQKALLIRKSVIEMLMEAKSGHTAGPLGMADIFSYIYFHSLNHDPENPQMEDRDRLVLSNGHICPVLYSTLAHAGYFELEELQTLRKFGSRLQGHPHREFLDSLETSSGPLGSGLSQAVGMALADRISGGDKTIYCLTGDGELNEGQNWEALMHAAKYKLDNLIIIVDRNYIQIDGATEDVMPLDPLIKKLEAFNCKVIDIDGHNFDMIDGAIRKAKNNLNSPTVIIANTTPGKGVSDWEGKYEWHGKPPTQEEGEAALKELSESEK
jgi:transketolase